MSIRRAATLAAVLALCCGCATTGDIPVRSEIVVPTEYPADAAFRWITPERQAQHPARFDAIREAVIEELQSRGFVVTEGAADFGVTARLVVGSTPTGSTGYRPGGFDPAESSGAPAKPGSITIEIVSLPDLDVLWRSTGGEMRPLVGGSVYQSVVRRLLAEFPPL